jgi:cytochrome o ubiquinol oxidase subunit 2
VKWLPETRVCSRLLPLALLAGGCDLKNTPLLEVKGPVALAERDLLLTASAIMLIVVIPVIVLALWYSWRYRASNESARYEPGWTYSARLDAVVWAIPALIVVALGSLVWGYTHRLDPYKRLDPSATPLEVLVVAQDWKWLFLYPGYGIATVNELAFPSQQPLSLKITSDTVMNAFFIPALGGQIYAMAGMRTELNLLAGAPGRFVGRNTQYSGRGFSNQQFEAIAMTRPEFDAWVEKVRRSPTALGPEAYERLAEPSIAHKVTYYSSYKAGLFEEILGRYAAHGTHVVRTMNHSR